MPSKRRDRAPALGHNLLHRFQRSLTEASGMLARKGGFMRKEAWQSKTEMKEGVADASPPARPHGT